MTGLHDSTLGMSVYNAIQRLGSISRHQALVFLQKNWAPGLEDTEVDAGANYLLRRKLVTEAAGILSARVLVRGAAATVARSPADSTELMLVIPHSRTE